MKIIGPDRSEVRVSLFIAFYLFNHEHFNLTRNLNLFRNLDTASEIKKKLMATR